MDSSESNQNIYSSGNTKKNNRLAYGFALGNLIFGSLVIIFFLLFIVGWYLIVENPLTPFLCKNVNQPCNSGGGPTVDTSSFTIPDDS